MTDAKPPYFYSSLREYLESLDKSSRSTYEQLYRGYWVCPLEKPPAPPLYPKKLREVLDKLGVPDAD